MAHLKQKIDENNSIDPNFHRLFIKAMLPLLKNGSKKVHIRDPNDMSKNNSEDSKAMVFEMPRTDVDLSDPQEGVNFTEENLDL